MTELLAALVVLGIGSPHLLRMNNAGAAVAATIWFAGLCLRALTALYVAIYLVLFLPNTVVFAAVTHWCWHTVLPLMTTHLGLDGHRVGDAAVILPAFVLAFSLVSVGVGVVRAARSVRSLLARSSLGQGPGDALIVGGPEVILGAAGIARPRVFVSAGALTVLDEDELAAGLAHERAHIVRQHRFVLVLAELCRGFARFLPGTTRTLGELHFQLERDADRWAVAQRNDPNALASAICKAASSRAPASPGLALLSGHGHVTRRVDELIEHGTSSQSPLARRAMGAIAAILACFVVALAASVPATAAAGLNQGKLDQQRHCNT